MKKIIFTMNINDYSPEIIKVTRPSVERWARKIGAEIIVINERKFPKMPITYEKFQMYELAKSNPADWYIFVDADAYIFNDFPDITELVNKDTVIVGKGGPFGQRFKIDEYFRRYGKNIDIGSWFFAFSDWCIDMVHPLEKNDLTLSDVKNNIFPINEELNGPQKVEKLHLIDDYLVARNICKYGLKLSLLIDNVVFGQAINSITHTCYDTIDTKLEFLKLIDEQDKTFNWSLLKDHEWKDIIKERLAKRGIKYD